MLRVFLALAIAAFLGGFWAGGAEAKEMPQCRSNGKCCKELNRFWDRISARAVIESDSPEDSVLRGDKDFLMLNSNKYTWDKKLKCPSMQSKIAEGFQLLYDFSQSKYASINYYDFSKNATNDKDFAFIIEQLDDKYALSSKTIFAVVLSAGNIGLLTPSTVASQIVHEADHVEYQTHHVICDHGQLKGHESCDETLGGSISDSVGAYTWQIIFLDEYAKSNADKNLRRSAKSMLKATIENQINTLPAYGPDGVTPLKKYYGIE